MLQIRQRSPEQLSIRIVPYNTREYCPFNHTHTVDLKDVIDEKDSSKLHLNLGFSAIEKYKKVIAPDFLNNPDNDLLTVTASYAKDADSDLLTASDLTDLHSTPEKPRDFTTIREISGKRILQ